MREDYYYTGKLRCLWTIECILLWCSFSTLGCGDKHHSQQSQLGHSVITSSVNEGFIPAGTVREPMTNKGYALAESAQWIQSIDICVLVVDICTLRDSLLITPCQCCSASCQKLLRSPLHCGKFSIKQMNPWWDSSWTVSIIFAYCKLKSFLKHNTNSSFNRQQVFVVMQWYSDSKEKQYNNCIIWNRFLLWITSCFSDSQKTLAFFNHDYKGDFQTVTFEGPDIRKIFYGSFHKVSLC